jgi:endo-1,4-beta-xylanase
MSAGGSKATGGRSSTGGSSTRGGTSSIGTGGKTSATGGTATGGASTTIKTCTATGTLKQAAACNNKLIGAAISQGSLSTSGYANAAGEFNYFTPENEMKWDTIESSQNNFNYGPGDAIVNFATQRSAKVKGHTLVWHSQLPGWVSSAADVKTVMINHITSVMNHYKGKLHAWDVVNEAVDVDDKKTGMGNARLRESVFKTKIGTDYIDLAFQTARKVDPSAKLFYNDYSTEGMNDKSDYVYKMVKDMKARGIPIDGVGIQTHIGTPNDSPTAAEVKENINRLAALGLEIQISELDVNGCDGITDAAMATIYHDLVAACVQQPLCTAITVWGINDGRSWLNSFSEAGCNGQSARALLFTDSYQKKATYTAVVNALTGN